ncbi:CYTH and CHAD domain-containing protein [Nocardioides marmotae]|uniref:CYTH and CHAD domain-containing protein n=1 Tax=Nocardioides marmotae TaxID=2663857 RepID=UPI0012B604F7|nr:CYTH and CHAD domain-containing protein [Nocardioides marmotae]MBC9733954.1 CYTH and CHAD domain-containing protein [Nocardioides marmotae]MTB85057.1 CHAD domain-containing protein [Nocardioides marmotae]
MPRTHLEIEHTYAPPADAEPPGLAGEGGLPGVARVSEPVVHELHATYHDTSGLDLTAAGVTLRARTGGPDEGWHLKLPAAGGREEMHHRLGRGETVPARLRELVVPWTRGEALAPVATVTTRRTVRQLLGEDGAVLAELADDEVTGTPTGGPPVTWREWELELVEGDPSLLAAADELFADHGAPVRPLARKIVAVLGDRVPRLPTAEGPVLGAVGADVGELKILDSRLRRGEPAAEELAAVVRRLRSALWVLRPQWGRAVTDPVRAELAWLAEPLGEAADLVAARERILAALEGERVGVAPVRRLVRTSLGQQEKADAARTLERLRDDRYLALLRTLDRLVAEPPSAEPPTKKQLRRRFAKAARTATAQTRQDEDSLDPERLLAHLERLADVATLARAAVGKEAKRTRRRAEDLAWLLHDARLRGRAQREVRALADAATTTGEAFLLGRLHALLEVRLPG